MKRMMSGHAKRRCDRALAAPRVSARGASPAPASAAGVVRQSLNFRSVPVQQFLGQRRRHLRQAELLVVVGIRKLEGTHVQLGHLERGAGGRGGEVLQQNCTGLARIVSQL